MPVIASENPTRRRALEVDERRERLGIPKAEIARRVGRETAPRYNYLAAVLRGETTSAPIVKEVERVLDEIEAEREGQAA